MPRSAAARASDYRSLRKCGLDVVLIDIDRELVLALGLMSAFDYDNPVEGAVLVALRLLVPEYITSQQARSASVAGVTGWPVKAFRPSVGVSELGFEFHPLRHIILNFQGFHGGFLF